MYNVIRALLAALLVRYTGQAVWSTKALLPLSFRGTSLIAVPYLRLPCPVVVPGIVRSYSDDTPIILRPSSDHSSFIFRLFAVY